MGFNLSDIPEDDDEQLALQHPRIARPNEGAAIPYHRRVRESGDAMGYEEYKKKIMPLCPVAITRAYLVAIEAHSQLGRPRVCEAVEQLLRPP